MDIPEILFNISEKNGDCTEVDNSVTGDDADGEKLTQLKYMKEIGNDFFKHGQWDHAYNKYCEICHMINSDDNNNTEEYNLLISCHSNAAQAALNLNRYIEAANHCTCVLYREPKHKKSLFRRIIALFRLNCSETNSRLLDDLYQFDQAGSTKLELEKMANIVELFENTPLDISECMGLIGLNLFHSLHAIDGNKMNKTREKLRKFEEYITISPNVLIYWGLNLSAICIGGNIFTSPDDTKLPNDDFLVKILIDEFIIFQDISTNWEIISDILYWTTWDWDRDRVTKLLISLGYDKLNDLKVWNRIYKSDRHSVIDADINTHEKMLKQILIEDISLLTL